VIEDAIIVMPAYNEEKVIGDTLAELTPVAPDVLVVDDGSEDNTAEMARAAGASVLKLATNLNYGGALQAGFRHAVRNTDFPYIVTFDADGQHDPAYIDPLLVPLRDGEADYVLGSRYLEGGSTGASFSRDMGARLFAAATSIALGARITDPTSGLVAMTREVARVFLLELFPQDYPDADVIIMLDRMGFKISEVPVTMRPSKSGKSMHAGLIKPLYYIAKMSVSMLHLATRGDLMARRKEAQIAG
jgi:glycosyltransferase involved in cell wall biosynthesis